MGQAATADVVIRSRKKGAKVYRDVQEQLTRLASKAKLFGLASGAVAIGGLTALTVKSFASADALAKQAEKIGISTQRLGARARNRHWRQFQSRAIEDGLIRPHTVADSPY